MATAIQEFIGDQVCLIAEPSAAFAASIQTVLTHQGVPGKQVVIAKKFEDARRIINEVKPRLLVVEYRFEDQLGLTLVEQHERVLTGQLRICIMITRDGSDSAVAEAAEEQVDSFVIKPFSNQVFLEKLNTVVFSKQSPSPYSAKIEQGKLSLNAGDFATAKGHFENAKTMHERPALAYYYIGRTLKAQGDHQGAVTAFRKGRSIQNLHYKCVLAEFEELVDMQKFSEAIPLVELVQKNYPLTAKRLTQMFLVSTFTEQYTNLLTLFEAYLTLELRSPELIEVASTSFLTGGRHYLTNKHVAKACEFFEKGTIVASRDIFYLEKIIHELLHASAFKEAHDFLGKALPVAIGRPEHNRLSFLVDVARLPAAQAIEKGRKVVMDGHADQETYFSFVRLLAQEGKITLAETVIIKAVESYPDLRQKLYKLLEESQVKPTGS